MKMKMSKDLYLLILLLIKVITCTESFQKLGKKPSNSVTIRQNGVCTNHRVNDFVPNPADCRLFYLCLENGQAVMAACPPTMFFNPESKLCDPSSDKCNIEIVTETPTAPPPDNSQITDASRYCATLPPQQDMNRITFIGSSSNCQQYYICYYGQAILQDCSANLHWNANIAKCDLPSNAGCTIGNNNNNVSPPPNTDATELIHCPTYGQHIFPHMGRCDLFIYCVKGNAILQQCPFYYNFDIVSKNCKWRTSAICVRDLNISFRKLTHLV